MEKGEGGKGGEGGQRSDQSYWSRASPEYQDIFFLFLPSVHSEVDRFCHGENNNSCSDLEHFPWISLCRFRPYVL